ncbi:MAG: peptidoglycan DD-metalloendopeptidase family protein [Candidatus Omnitrophota bacterium]
MKTVLIHYLMSYQKLFVSVSVLFLSACASAPPSSQAPHTASSRISAVPGARHTVARGETLWRICRLYQVDLEDLLEANKISDSESIPEGRVLVIPNRKKIPRTNFTSKDNTGDFIWPAKGKILSAYRQKTGGVANKGIDIDLTGDRGILAAGDGRVIFVGVLAGYGQTVIIDHKNGLSTVYCKLAKSGLKPGEEVRKGQLLSQAEEKGAFHFEVRRNNRPQNPLYYLN